MFNPRTPGERQATTRASPTILTPSLRLRRAIHRNDATLVARILKAVPQLLHNPDHTSTTAPLSNSNLHLAASLGHIDIVKLLVNLGHEEPTIALNELNQAALHLAAAEGYTEVVHFLSESFPAAITRKDSQGLTPIMYAAASGHDTALQILLTYAPCGAEAAVNLADNEGNTALHLASANGDRGVLRTLVAAGADVARENKGFWTPVNYSGSVQTEVVLRGLIQERKREGEKSNGGGGMGRGLKMRLMGGG